MTSVILSDRALVSMTGPDARQLMHNVLTVSMERVDARGIAFGGLLTPQGKIICDFIVHKADDDGYLVDIRRESVDDFIRRMTLYRLRANVEIAKIENDLAVCANWTNGAPEKACLDPRFDNLGHRFIARPDDIGPDDNLAAYHGHRIDLAIPEGGLDYVFSETFPHDAAMDQLNGIDFEKGCYVGQEVISRMAHRGTARRRVMAVAGSDPLPPEGTDLLAGPRVIGRLGTSHGGNGIAIVRLDRLHKAMTEGAETTLDGQSVRVSVPDWAGYALDQFAA